jgi:hypothetical protein
MLNITKNTGHIPNIFSKDDIEHIKKFLLKMSKTIGYGTGGDDYIKAADHYGADHTSIIYPWIQKIIKPKLYKYFGDFNLVFISFNNSYVPFDIHSDEYWHKNLNLSGKPLFTFLIPCSVDNIETNCNLASTVVFDECGGQGAGRIPPELINKEENALQYHDSFLSHCLPEDLKKVNVKQRHIWNYGALVWFDSNLLHTSGSFDGFKTKQCLVGHTYVE